MGFGSTLGMALGTAGGAWAGGPAGAAVGAGLGGAVGGMFDSSGAGDAAQAMHDQANQWRSYVQGQQDKALSLVNTPSQIAAYDQALQGQEANVRRQESLVAQMDPAIIEAGKQTTQLLQGHAAPVLNQMQNQRSLQRTQMMDQLRTQLGPGAETSSAGIMAQQKFDQDTASIMNNAQQEYLDKVSGLAMGGTQTLGQSLSQVHNVLSTMQTQSPGAQAAELMAKFTGAMAGPQQALMESAGGAGLEKQIQSQKMQGLAQNLIGAGAFMYGKNSLGGTQATPPGTPTSDADLEKASGLGQGSFAQNRAAGMPVDPAQQGTLAATLGPQGGGGNTARYSLPVTRASSSPSYPTPQQSTANYLPFMRGYTGTTDAAADQMPRNAPYTPYRFGNNFGNTAGE